MPAITAAKRFPAILFSILILSLLTMPALAAEKSGFLGIVLQDLTPSMSKALQLGDRPGVMVNDVVDAGPAEKAGLLDGDVILEFNGNTVVEYKGLTEAVRATRPGQKVSVLVLRDGKERSMEVEIGERTEKDVEWTGDEHVKIMRMPHGEGDGPNVFFHGGGASGERDIIIEAPADDRGYLGIKMDSLNEQLGKYFGVKDGAGVLVTEVVTGSPAAGAGLQAGDVVVKAGGQDIASPEALHESMSGTEPGQNMKLQVMRKGSRKEVTVKLGEMPAGASMKRTIEIIDEEDDRPGADVERRIIVKRKLRGGDGGSPGGLREEIDQLRQEMKQLREELKK